MRGRTSRIVTSQKNSWTESFWLDLEDELAMPWNRLDGSRDAFEFEFTPLLGPVIVYRRAVEEDWLDLSENRWSLALVGIPLSLDSLVALEESSSGAFWQTVHESRRATHIDTRVRLARTLSTKPVADVLGFQFELWNYAHSAVRDLGCTWAGAGAAVLEGEERYNAIIRGQAAVPSSIPGDFEELLDIAEIAARAKLVLPDGTTSRSVMRDSPEGYPQGVDSVAFNRTFGLDVPEWTRLPWRWEGWRARGVDGQSSWDIVILANRPWGDGLVQMAEAVGRTIASTGMSMEGLPQVVFPEIRRPGLRTPPIFYSTHAGLEYPPLTGDSPSAGG